MSRQNTPACFQEVFRLPPRLNPLGGRAATIAPPRICLIDEVFPGLTRRGASAKRCQLLARKMLPQNGFIGLIVDGALTPARAGKKLPDSQLMKGGYIDWIVFNGGTLYITTCIFGLDMRLAFGLSPLSRRRRIALARGSSRIYDVLFDYKCVASTRTRLFREGHSLGPNSADDGPRRVSLSARTLRSSAGAKSWA